MDVCYEFVNYGEDLAAEAGTIVLDVGLKTVPGVVDHHHPEAEPECTASLLVKYPRLVLDHLQREDYQGKQGEIRRLRIITHRLPDFDSVASIFLTLKLLELGRVDESMAKIAAYTKLVDSARLPLDIDLVATPYSILRALFAGAKKDEEKLSRDRVAEGLRFMRFLYEKSEEGMEIMQDRLLFKGVDRYERAMRRAEDDYFRYLDDLGRSQRITLHLPVVSGRTHSLVDGLIVRNPRSFLLKEWARRDMSNSSLREGFSFILTNFGNERYILGVDPEKGVNLRGLADLLNARESGKRAARGKPPGMRWYDGNCPFFNFRIIVSPQDGTTLIHEEVASCLMVFGNPSG